MKRFIIYSLYFVIPFFLLYALNLFFYEKEEGDLIRLGFLYSNPTPRSIIDRQFENKIYYDTLSAIDFLEKNQFDILTIGDSFSELGEQGYKNFLAKDNFDILHIDRFISGINPNQKLIELINSSFFEKIKIDYIILQNVERNFNGRLRELDFYAEQDLDALAQQIREHSKLDSDHSTDFFSKALLQIPVTNLLYNFKPKPLKSQTYKVKLNSNELFTNSPDNLLFYESDLINMQIKNDSVLINNSVKSLNRINSMLKKKGIKLIVIVSPDKYDLYYDYIVEKKEFVEPKFFRHYNKIEKDYIEIKSYKVLKNSLPKVRDLYYYDDTHWSPKAAIIIANKIKEKIPESKLR